MKEAIIVSCNDSYDYITRTKYVRDYLAKKGYDVKFLISDFDHRSKKKYKAERQDKIIYIPINSYRRNISIGRIIAQITFAKKVGKYIGNNTPDLVYHCAPPNSTIFELSRIKEKKSFFLITEIGDMWPETLPVRKIIKKLFYIFLKIWASRRDKYLYNSNVIITECDLFKNYLSKKIVDKKIWTIYFCKPYLCKEFEKKIKMDGELFLVYLGSINNIIDIDLIEMLLYEIQKRRKVTLHIIGDGEYRETFISKTKKVSTSVIFHGIIFDESKKKQIFDKAHFALNIMKESVYVGMTMKSLDYFSYGVPIINNINGDIKKIIDEEEVGININKKNLKACVDDIVNMKTREYIVMRNNVKQAHDKYFSIEKFENALSNLIVG